MTDWIADSVKVAITSPLLFVSVSGSFSPLHPISGLAETPGGELGELACAWAV